VPGPLPTPGSIRDRRGRYARVELPAGGRRGRVPRWPFTDGPSADEVERWRDPWRTPAATQWEAVGCGRIVARLARLLVRAEGPETHRVALSEARLLETQLGLTPYGAARLGWHVAPEQRQPPAAGRSAFQLRAVE
jgi:hypothetical protein